jgi:hypothetical protein
LNSLPNVNTNLFPFSTLRGVPKWMNKGDVNIYLYIIYKLPVNTRFLSVTTAYTRIRSPVVQLAFNVHATKGPLPASTTVTTIYIDNIDIHIYIIVKMYS